MEEDLDPLAPTWKKKIEKKKKKKKKKCAQHLYTQ